ncbi:MAG: 30S ribosomal protein S2 [Parcubacteria group bacterium GW2011_GWC1_35_8]|uniref:Small ribosomal subunit protein uS2 n=3 Tax=Candidatus Nomuraibacteriota TaxID=1752729 RepID=A0A1F6YTP5_9BACT|nr:MAG: 30S ribosomal protein S2 [Parcubacteria group bacterium GW2011_GWC1_35_8]KKP89829.1 MAG: 30S ribosomal protein S2 [Candidatus Nomurabacteria bacterium GW2011_GWC2_35_8]OGJ05549.1 MAG: 30S ribosomal protein S2 [Candidatus Nomurabacteria bacterium RIFOXYA2_FULL_35_9]OGJ06131.1 MAG: 30S ribosomal protein S2 [Candidatus Nomurabacteria bacterium RIFOXYA1_FULL_35_17]OGJ09718.1 MAG: 30S ribosomal protein S2 [Candidatus Nomurabacteria bacterium RIFOXYC2_FULL_36_19]OGJ14562.1 MAG: 30S ribosomal
MQKIKDTKGISENTDTVIEKMFRVGAHYGYSKTRRHPSLSKYIYATKNKTDIIDLEKTNIMLEKATEFVKGLSTKGKIILFVGTKPEAKEVTKSIAESLNMPYVNERWIGGTLSNFTEIKKRITELENYQKDSKEGGLDKYTKKERVVMAKKMEKLARYYTGLLGLKKAPDALFVIDARAEHIATTEAKNRDVPIISLVNSDSNIKGIDYPIIGNDSSIPSIKFFITHLANAYKIAQNSAPIKKA